jgi:hypothetical protein
MKTKNKRHYLMTDNRVDIYGGWYAEYDTRKEAFQGALFYLQIRLTSGIPTRKPYILTIEEIYNNGCKKGRKWDIKLEIANVTDKTSTMATSNFLKDNHETH